jgi:penicillin-binding protein 1C
MAKKKKNTKLSRYQDTKILRKKVKDPELVEEKTATVKSQKATKLRKPKVLKTSKKNKAGNKSARSKPKSEKSAVKKRVTKILSYKDTKKIKKKSKILKKKDTAVTQKDKKRNKLSVKSVLKSTRIKILRRKIILFTVVLGLSLSLLAVWIFWDVPLPTQLTNRQIPVSTKLFDRNGELIFEIYTDTRRTPVKLDDIPTHVIQSTIAIEDKDFYKHHGVSVSGIIRAAYKTVFKQKLEGGSTLTQQLVKNALLTPDRTIRRKIREFALTLIVETIYSKEQILEMYLNQIPYGSTAYGIGAASELYFSKKVKDLTLSEAALLAGLPAAPTRFSPFGAHPELARGRQETVLRRMVEDEYLSSEEADDAIREDLRFAEPEELKAPHFALWVKDQLAEKYGDVVVEQGGLRVTTTLDLNLQEFAEDVVATEAAKLKDSNVGNGAALVTRPASGEILAMVGSKDYFAKDEDGKVNIVFSERQPGSSIKPLNYALALRDGKITAATPLADVPTCFGVTGQKNYCPRNYDFNFHGAVQARFALGNSYNIPAVRVLALNGIENFFNFARDLGISTWTHPDNYGLSLTLGGGEVKMYDMATAFGVFANQGIKQPLISILKVEDWKGEILEETDFDGIEGDRILDQGVTFLISHILHDNNARSAAFGTGSFLNVREHPEVSVKTGTTNDLRDNWTIGYTKHILTAAWVGNNDNTPMSRAVSGVSGASPIWNKIMKETLDRAEEGEFNEEDEGHAWPTQPDGVVGSNVCATTGKRFDNPNDPGCPTRFEYFLKDYIGASIESGNKDIEVFKDTGQLANKEALPDQKETQNHPFMLDPLGTLICLDCPTASSAAQISYPLVGISNSSE